MPEMGTYLIKKLNSKKEYFEIWKSFKEQYAEKLRSIKRSEQAFTDHSYEHCIRIYQNIDLLIGKTKKGSLLNIDEIFILAIAVLLHDLIMSKDRRKETRERHSLAVFNYIKEEVKKESDSFMASKLTNNQLEALAWVCYGHSDVKTPGGAINVLEEIPQDDCLKGKYNNILRLPLLSAILRIADELDITSERIGTERIDKLTDVNEESHQHFRALELIKSVTIDKKSIVAHVVDEEIKDDKENDFELLVNLKTKIGRELQQVNSVVFDNYSDFSWDYKDFQLKSKKFSKEIYDYESLENPLLQGASEIKQTENTKVSGYTLNEAMNTFLTSYVSEHKLFIDGHFKIDNSERVRDWVDVHKLLLDRVVFKKIVDAFVERFNELGLENKRIVFVGLDFPGLLLCSYLAFKLLKPFTYTISGKFHDYHIDEEIKVLCEEIDGVIIVTDAIINFNSIEQIVTNLRTIKLFNIFSIFLRDRNDKRAIPLGDKYKEITYILNNNFNVTVCNNRQEECSLFQQYREHIYNNVPF